MGAHRRSQPGGRARYLAPISEVRIGLFSGLRDPHRGIARRLTTRVRELSSIRARPFYAFAVGVAVNLALGFVLSTQVFGDFWSGVRSRFQPLRSPSAECFG